MTHRQLRCTLLVDALTAVLLVVLLIDTGALS